MLKNILFAFCLFFSLLTTSIYGQDDTVRDPSEPTQEEKEIFALTDQIKNNPSVQAGSIPNDSVPSLPIGLVKKIGETVYIVAIDSAFFLQDRAYFNAYMALNLPNGHRPLAFAAKKINFNPSGVLFNQGVKMELVSETLIRLGPNIELYIKGDGQTYVEFDCNGYKRTRIKGEFRFNGKILQPVDPNAKYVTAQIDVFVEDIKNLFATVTFSPFMVQGMKDYKFTVSEASVDMSDFVNPSATLPVSFTDALGDEADANIWRGFYLKTLKVTMPRKISKANNSNTEFGVENLFIDNSGVTGLAFANNVIATTGEGNMSGWGYSIKRVEIGLQSNTLVRGMMKGEIAVKPLDNDTLGYMALMYKQHPDSTEIMYNFTASSTDTMSFNLTALKSRLYVYPSSVLSVSNVNPQNKLIPSLNLNGKFSVESDRAMVDKVAYENFHVTTVKPYIMSATFDLISDSTSLVNFPISLTNLGFEVQDTTKLIFVVGVGINLGDPESKVFFSADAGFNIFANINHNPTPTQSSFSFDKFTISDISFDLQTTPFDLRGLVSIKDDDPVFGKLFYGAIQFRINKVMQEYALFRAGFGRKTNPATQTTAAIKYKYWFVDAQVPINATLGNVTITKIIGGASYKVKPNLSNQELINKAKETAFPSSNVPFVPDYQYGLAVKAGVGFKYTSSEEALNGDAVFGILFNSNGGLYSIDFIGHAYMLVKINERNDPNVKNKIEGDISVNYNHETKTFAAGINATADIAKSIYGTMNVTVHIDTNDWYIYFNTPSQRASIDFLSPTGSVLLATDFYAMFGTIIEPMGQLPNWAAGLASASSARYFNMSDAANANGLCIGAYASADIGKEYYLDDFAQFKFYAILEINIDVGFDVMMMKFPEEAVCAHNGEKFGINNRFCAGQLYFRLHANAGGKRVNQNNGDIKVVQLAQIDLVALLQGTFPKPTYLAGACSAEISFLGINIGSKTFDFDMGQRCSITY